MEQERIEKLAEYLEEPVENFKEGYRENIVENTETGEEYFVGTYDESYEEARQYIENVVDDLGLEAFTPDFQTWITENALEEGWFEDTQRESYTYYVEDIENENDETFENRLISELYEEDILTEEDFDNWGEEHPTVKEDVDIEDKKEEYIDKLCDREDAFEWYKFNFGLDRDFVKNGPSIDMEKVVEECIDQDGIAHFVAGYDGKEIELDDDLFAYRTD